jgi:nanoRNase/pAp phosphatase (c-di-AMP/oligoRNAs hydrolase)
MGEKFDNLLGGLLSVTDKYRNLYIQIPRQPGADSIVSASVLSDMLRDSGFSPVIIHTGVVGNSKLMSLVDAVGINLVRCDAAGSKNLISTDDQIILVDCQRGNGNVSALPGEYIACIDHHPEIAQISCPFEDIRPDYGACSTIIYEYAVGCGYNLTPVQAALLIYGIKTDTDNLLRKKYVNDIDIFCSLYKTANLTVISKVCVQAGETVEITTTDTPYGNLTIKNNIGYSHAGDNKSREFLAVVADKLISLADADFIVVYSKTVNGYSFSVRSQMNHLHAGEITRVTFLKANGDGGGQAAMAGGTVPRVAFINTVGDKAVLEKIMDMFEETMNEISLKY